MPELPETETIARDLDDMIAGAVIDDVQVARPNVLREMDEVALSHALVHARITRVWRRAKLVVMDLAVSTVAHVVVQPRFTGGLFVAPDTAALAAADYVCVSFTLSDGRILYYRDVRRLGTVSAMSAERFDEYQRGLGVEPLDPTFTTAVLSVLLRASRRPVKVTLMDQRRLAGVGNIYANEALWLAGIDPSRASSDLGDTEVVALHAALLERLQASIAARGTSFRDYRDARGERGSFVDQLAAYGRAGKPCLRCGRTLVGTHAIDGRTTVFCATCQR